ncbi:hypothetical protein [Tsukamurella sp. 1534]|uniref:hypothetical protein n=1 Tax=Tsukamurella sp. 1534 TaxID=1151061 RepID=UPI0002F7E217|nr:hypothetical protein [Tsukamurella sp. 1534]
MPWSSFPAAPGRPARLGWSPEGPPRASGGPGGGWSSVTQRSASDTGHGEDTADLLAHLLATDTGTGSDSAVLLAHLTATDSGVGFDTVALLAHLTGSDSGAGTDAATWLEHLDRLAVDTGTGSDTAALLAHLLATDTGAGGDVAALLAHLTGSDSGAGTDTARPAYMNPYSGSKAATTLNHATWTDLLTFTAAGNGTATVTFTVSHSWGSNGFHWASEDRGIRILVGGTQVASQMQTYTTQSWSSTLTQPGVTVPAGAYVQIQGYGETTVYSACRTVTISAASMTVTGVA